MATTKYLQHLRWSEGYLDAAIIVNLNATVSSWAAPEAVKTYQSLMGRLCPGSKDCEDAGFAELQLSNWFYASSARYTVQESLSLVLVV